MSWSKLALADSNSAPLSKNIQVEMFNLQLDRQQIFLTCPQAAASRVSSAKAPHRARISLHSGQSYARFPVQPYLTSLQHSTTCTIPFWNTLLCSRIPPSPDFLLSWLLLWQLVLLCLTFKCWSSSGLGLRPSCLFPEPLYDFICSKMPLILKALFQPRFLLSPRPT